MIVIYEYTSGKIRLCGEMSDADAVANTRTGESWSRLADNTVTDATHYIAEGVPVAISDPPTSRHVWDWTTKTWGLPSTIRADMKQLIRTEASRRLIYPFNNSGTFFRCDAQGQSAIIGAATLYPLTVPSGWTWPDINNVPIAMTSPEWQLFWNAVANRPMQIQSVVEFLFSLVDDPETADAVVAAIEPATDTYWPETARP